jgi:hypothetical protein
MFQSSSVTVTRVSTADLWPPVAAPGSQVHVCLHPLAAPGWEHGLVAALLRCQQCRPLECSSPCRLDCRTSARCVNKLSAVYTGILCSAARLLAICLSAVTCQRPCHRYLAATKPALCPMQCSLQAALSVARTRTATPASISMIIQLLYGTSAACIQGMPCVDR